MMSHNSYIYILIMAAVTYAMRVLPIAFIKKRIQNRFLQSFLYYIPYVTLAVMTFPAIVYATKTPLAGVLALIAGIFAAWRGAGLFSVALYCCCTVFVVQLIPWF